MPQKAERRENFAREALELLEQAECSIVCIQSAVQRGEPTQRAKCEGVLRILFDLRSVATTLEIGPLADHLAILEMELRHHLETNDKKTECKQQFITGIERARALFSAYVSREPHEFARHLAWKEEYETGIPGLDFVHRHLLLQASQILDRFPTHNKDPKKLSQLLSELIGVLKYHFKSENELVHLVNLDQEQSHGHDAHHDEFLAKISRYEQELREGLVLPSQTFLQVLAKDFITHLEYEAKIIRANKK